MLILVKARPGGEAAIRAVAIARGRAADLVLVQDAVGLAQKEMLEGFCGAVHVLEEDLLTRGVSGLEKGVHLIGYEEMEDLMTGDESVMGFF